RRHRPVRLPVLLLAALGVVAHLGRRRRPTLVHRGILPSRARPPPSATLEVLASLDHPGHARPRLPGRRHRTRHPTHPDRLDHTDRQRVSPTRRRPATDHQPDHGADNTNTEPDNLTTADANTNDPDLRLQ